MKVIDRVYGEEEIMESVLIDLINSKVVQRLKGISQFGMPREYYHINGFSRYEHSVGVLILLRRLGASIEEQVAGLLHDVSHTAFSHVVDWAIGDPTREDFQDKNHLKFIEKSELKGILTKYNLDYSKIAKIEEFGLLEQEAPGLCADRVDYTLREMRLFGDKGVDFMIKSLANFDGKIVFNSLKAAEAFAFGYARCQKEHWGGNQARVRYYILADILKEAIEKKIICLDDLYRTESQVLNILMSSGNEHILGKLNALRNGFKIINFSGEGGVLIKKKFRYVDPDVIVGCETKKLSELSSEYGKNLKIQKVEGGVPASVRIIY